MSLPFDPATWKIEKIGVIGPGIVGMPMAGMLANARLKIGAKTPAKVVVIQRNSKNSGWKVEAINKGKSVIGGIEPGLDKIVTETVNEKLLSASHDFSAISDADVILISVQTDKKGTEPDYGPLFGALENLAKALKAKPQGKIPLIVFESTLAPTTMDTLIRKHFEKHGLTEGREILLGNSPNRVMPGRLVERIRASDKLIGGLHPETPKLITRIYKHIVKKGILHETNSITAEIVKTLENAYRDVRIAFSTEIVRYCDHHDIDYYNLREKVNLMLVQTDNASNDPNAVPSGGLLIPMLGVGGHCLPKDGILLWWRGIEIGLDTSSSLILKARQINDESPAFTFEFTEKIFGNLKNKRIAMLGVAYRFNSEDTRNSPTLALANHTRELGLHFEMHDPHVKKDDQNLLKFKQENHFSNDLKSVLEGKDLIILCTAHKFYLDNFDVITANPNIMGIMDACNIYRKKDVNQKNIVYNGIGRGKNDPGEDFISFVHDSFRVMERGLANELLDLINFYNNHYAHDDFNKVKFNDVQQLARTCSTGCEIADPGEIKQVPNYNGFKLRLITGAVK